MFLTSRIPVFTREPCNKAIYAQPHASCVRSLLPALRQGFHTSAAPVLAGLIVGQQIPDLSASTCDAGSRRTAAAWALGKANRLIKGAFNRSAVGGLVEACQWSGVPARMDGGTATAAVQGFSAALIGYRPGDCARLHLRSRPRAASGMLRSPKVLQRRIYFAARATARAASH